MQQTARKFSLSLVLVIPFLLEIFVAVGLTGWLSLRNGQKAVNDLATQLRSEVSDRIEQHLESFLAFPEMVNKNVLDAIEFGWLNTEDPRSMERYFYKQLQLFPTVSYVQFGNEQRKFLGFERLDGGDFDIQIADAATGYSMHEYATDREGHLTDRLLRATPNYDPRRRPWYVPAVRKGRSTWVNIYTYVGSKKIATTASTPVYDKGGKLVGVVGTDLVLSDISKFLSSLKIGKNGQTFIMERSGLLVASSVVEKTTQSLPKAKNSGRIPATESSDILTRRTAEYLSDRFGNLQNIRQEQQLDFTLSDQRQFLQVVPYQDHLGLDWLIVVVVPEADFMAAINANTRTTILLCLLALAVAAILGIFTARLITGSILDLCRASVAIANGDLEQQVGGKRIQEVDLLAHTFNRMASQLKTSFNALQNTNNELEQRVVERTAQIQQQHAFLRTIIDSDPNAIFVKDWNGKFVLVNQALARVYGTTVEELIGKTDADFNSNAAEVANYLEADREVMQTGVSKILEETVTIKTGEVLYFQSIKISLPSETPQVLGVAIDITERKQFEAQLQQAKQVADSANQAKSEFLANMSHELRTPLNGILGYAQILMRDRNQTEIQRNGVGIIHQCGSHLLTLINDILDLSKIEARKMEMYPNEFHFLAFLHAVSEICRIRAEQKGIAFISQFDPSLPIGVQADEKRLRQVLINLLGNAIKFTDRGGVTFKVGVIESSTIKSQANTLNAIHKIRFQIIDTGVGMSEEQRQKIFTPFEQVGETKRMVEGTGLGLAISSKIVQVMGSQIRVTSQLRVGSQFWFDLDLPCASEFTLKPTFELKGTIVGFTGNKKKILVVDDRWENRSVIVNLLTPVGFEVVEAENGTEGLEKVNEFNPDAIITDLVMPVMDGFEFLRRLRDSNQFKDTIVIVSSASVFEADQYKSLDAGANAFLPKPVQVSELFELLEKQLGVSWIYTETTAESTTKLKPNLSQDEYLVIPPLEQLEILQDLAKKGNLKAIIKQAEELKKLDEQWIPFAEKVGEMARGFQEKQLRAFLDEYQIKC